MKRHANDDNHCGHNAMSQRTWRPLAAVFALTGLFFLVELAGGIWTKSLALLTDALHMAADMVALGVSLLAARFSKMPPDAKRTFGYERLEVLAALANGAWLLFAVGVILREAIIRWSDPRAVLAPQMLAIAAAGLAVNLLSGFILYSASKENLNVRAAFLHVMSDAMGSVGAIMAGVVIMRTGWLRADPLASVVIAAGIVASSLWLLRDSVHILLEGAPTHLDLEEIRAALAGLPGVKEVHDLHLWSLTKGSESFSGHLVIDQGLDQAAVLDDGRELLRVKFKLSHVTLQIET